MDVCFSCYRSHFRHLRFACDLEDVGSYYRDYERLMTHWREVLPLPMLETTYEDLVANQEAVSRRIVEFCGLEWDKRCLRFFENPRPVQTASKLEVRQPMYATSIGRWQKYATHLGSLLARLNSDRSESPPCGGKGT
jgi:hypothetical protein